jgi:hypothetical protein
MKGEERVEITHELYPTNVTFMITNVSFLKLICILVASIITLHQSNFSQIFLLSRIEYIIKETILVVNVTFVGYNSLQ